MDSALFSEIAANTVKRSTFVNSVVSFLDKYDFEGVDIDWEWPGTNYESPNPEDRNNHVQLLKDLYDTLNPMGKSVSTVIIAWPGLLEENFDIAAFSPYVDFINLVSFDFHGFWPGAEE